MKMKLGCATTRLGSRLGYAITRLGCAITRLVRGNELMHKVDGVWLLHVKASCKSFERHRACFLGDKCEMGHNFPELRHSLAMWRRREAERNFDRYNRPGLGQGKKRKNRGRAGTQGSRGGLAGRGRGGNGMNRGVPGTQGSLLPMPCLPLMPNQSCRSLNWNGGWPVRNRNFRRGYRKGGRHRQ